MRYHEYTPFTPFTHATAKRYAGKAVRVHARLENHTICCGTLKIVDKDSIVVNELMIPNDAVVMVARQTNETGKPL